MNKALISAINGPIKVIITQDKINKEQFFTDTERNIRIKKGIFELRERIILVFFFPIRIQTGANFLTRIQT